MLAAAYRLEILVVFSKGGQGGQRVILPVIVQRVQVAWKNYGWGVIVCPNAFDDVLHVALHCPEKGRDGRGSWVLDSQPSLLGSHGGYQDRVFRDCFV